MTRSTTTKAGRIAEVGAVPATARCQVLEQRLEDGYCRIEQALVEGADARAWEQFWLDLLAEYKAVCLDLAAAA